MWALVSKKEEMWFDMPITTFTTAEQRSIEDPILSSLLGEIDPKWIIEEWEQHPTFFNKNPPKLYRLLNKFDDTEAQVINFYNTKPGSSTINTVVKADLIAAFLYGTLVKKE